MFRTISALSLRQKLFILTIVFIPYSTIYLFGNPYLFLPMIFFIGYFLLSSNQLKGLLKVGGIEKLVYPWIIIWILILVGIIANYLPEYANIYRSVLQRRIIYLVFFIIAFNEFKRNPHLIKIVDNAILISIVIMLIFYFSKIGVTYSLEGRLSLFGAGTNSIGIWSVFGMIIALDQIVKYKLKWSVVIIFGLIIVAAFILMVSTGSRKSLAMIIVGSSMYLFYLNRNWSFKFKIIIPYIILSYFAFNYVTSDPVLQKRMEKEMERQNLGGRLPIWEETLKVIGENPIIGAGPGLVREELAASSLGTGRSAHNEFLTIGSLAGIPGVLIFIYFLWILGRKAYKTIKMGNTSSSLPFIFWVLAIMYLSTAGGALNSFTTWFLFAYISAKSLIFYSNATRPNIIQASY